MCQEYQELGDRLAKILGAVMIEHEQFTDNEYYGTTSDGEEIYGSHVVDAINSWWIKRKKL